MNQDQKIIFPLEFDCLLQSDLKTIEKTQLFCKDEFDNVKFPSGNERLFHFSIRNPFLVKNMAKMETRRSKKVFQSQLQQECIEDEIKHGSFPTCVLLKSSQL